MQMQRALTSRVTRGIAPGTPSIRRPLLATRPLLSKAPLHIPYSVAGAVEGSAPAGTAGPAVVEGAIVDGFPIAPEQLLNLAKAAFATNTGVDDDSVLADDFRFEFPIVSLARADYLKAVRGFNLKGAIPDLNPHGYDFRVDPFEPNRVWFTTRTTGTHTGTLRFGSKEYAATGKDIRGAPECCSYVFDADGKVKTFTGGYVMDKRVGNTGGMGALFGILFAIGVPVPKPGTLGFALAVGFNRFITWVRGIFGRKG